MAAMKAKRTGPSLRHPRPLRCAAAAMANPDAWFSAISHNHVPDSTYAAPNSPRHSGIPLTLMVLQEWQRGEVIGSADTHQGDRGTECDVGNFRGLCIAAMPIG